MIHAANSVTLSLGHHDYDVINQALFTDAKAYYAPVGNKLYAFGDGSTDAVMVGKGPWFKGSHNSNRGPDKVLYTQEWSDFPQCQFFVAGPKKTIFASGNPRDPLAIYISEPAGQMQPFRNAPHSTESNTEDPGLDSSSIYHPLVQTVGGTADGMSTVRIMGSNATRVTALSTRGDKIVVHTDAGCHILYAPSADQASTGYRVEQVAATNTSSAVNSQVVAGDGGTQPFWFGFDGQIYKDEAAVRGAEDFKSYSDPQQASWKSKGKWEREHPNNLENSFATYDPQSGMYWVFVESSESALSIRDPLFGPTGLMVLPPTSGPTDLIAADPLSITSEPGYVDYNSLSFSFAYAGDFSNYTSYEYSVSTSASSEASFEAAIVQTFTSSNQLINKLYRDLAPQVIYYVRVKATGPGGIVYSNFASMTTLGGQISDPCTEFSVARVDDGDGTYTLTITTNLPNEGVFVSEALNNVDIRGLVRPLADDQYGNIFLAVVEGTGFDSANVTIGGRAVYDTGFLKYRNVHWSSSYANNIYASSVPAQFPFLVNAINYTSRQFNQTGKVLFMCDSEGHVNTPGKYDVTDFTGPLPACTTLSGRTMDWWKGGTANASHYDWFIANDANETVQSYLSYLNQYDTFITVSSSVVVQNGGVPLFSSHFTEALHTFMDQGGGWIGLNDHAPYQANSNPLVEKFGFQFAGGPNGVNRDTNANNAAGDPAYQISTMLANTDYLPSGYHPLFENLPNTARFAAGLTEGVILYYDTTVGMGAYTISPPSVPTARTSQYSSGPSKSVTVTAHTDTSNTALTNGRLVIRTASGCGVILPPNSPNPPVSGPTGLTVLPPTSGPTGLSSTQLGGAPVSGPTGLTVLAPTSGPTNLTPVIAPVSGPTGLTVLPPTSGPTGITAGQPFNAQFPHLWYLIPGSPNYAGDKMYATGLTFDPLTSYINNNFAYQSFTNVATPTSAAALPGTASSGSTCNVPMNMYFPGGGQRHFLRSNFACSFYQHWIEMTYAGLLDLDVFLATTTQGGLGNWGPGNGPPAWHYQEVDASTGITWDVWIAAGNTTGIYSLIKRWAPTGGAWATNWPIAWIQANAGAGMPMGVGPYLPSIPVGGTAPHFFVSSGTGNHDFATSENRYYDQNSTYYANYYLLPV
jgi:hypothetical protein